MFDNRSSNYKCTMRASEVDPIRYRGRCVNCGYALLGEKSDESNDIFCSADCRVTAGVTGVTNFPSDLHTPCSAKRYNLKHCGGWSEGPLQRQARLSQLAEGVYTSPFHIASGSNSTCPNSCNSDGSNSSKPVPVPSKSARCEGYSCKLI